MSQPVDPTLPQSSASQPVSTRPSSRRSRLAALIFILAAVVVVSILLWQFLVPMLSYHARTPKSDVTGWQVISSPNPGLIHNGLYTVAAIAANDVWAVGDFSKDSSGSSVNTLIEHWNGVRWSVVQVPNLDTMNSALNGVAAISASDVWAVGYSSNSPINSSPIPPNITFSGTRTLIEHWDGTAWSIIENPNPGSTLSTLTGVAAISANDVWTVGYSSNSPINPNSVAIIQPLIEHWNGKQWKIVSVPNTGAAQNILNGIAAITPDDIWAVGDFCCNNNQPGFQPLIEHWNGKQWRIVPNAATGAPQSVLNSVTALSMNDVWAVGSSNDSGGPTANLTLIEHWNGQKWSIIQSPSNAHANGNGLCAVAAVSANDVWAVGYSSNIYPQQGQTLIEHWNGTKWNIISSPSPGKFSNNYLYAVMPVPHSSQVWAVGFSGSNFTPDQTIIEAWNL